MLSQLDYEALPYLDVNFSNKKFYIVYKETKKVVALSMEDHGTCLLPCRLNIISLAGSSAVGLI